MQDPRLMYKAGLQPVYVHNVDSAGWLAQGWSYEEQVAVEQAIVSQPLEPPEQPALEEPKPTKSKTSKG